jgi:Protein of unknown function (DUF3667)
MSEELAGVADVATGAVLAGAVEPDTGGGIVAAGAPCLNCATTLMGAHCHACGQKAQVHRTLKSFGHDFMHSVLHFDGKIWRTLPMLVWKPGELTRRYIHGERAKFVSPLALFLFSVFLTFAMYSFLTPKEIDLWTNTPATAAEAKTVLDADRKSIVEDIAKLEAEKKQATTDVEPTAWMDSELARHREALRRLDSETAPDVRKQLIAEHKFAVERRKNETEVRRLEAALARAKAAGQPTAKIEEDLIGARATIKLMTAATDIVTKGKSDVNVNFTGVDSLNNAATHAIENPQLLFYKVQSNAYKYSWALIPISVPFLWLLFFWRRTFKMFDHAVFITYSLCFMMTFGMVGALILSFATEGSFVFVTTILALIFVPPVHIYRQLHRAYETSRFGALWRAFALSNFALLALGLFATLIFALGVI